MIMTDPSNPIGRENREPSFCRIILDRRDVLQGVAAIAAGLTVPALAFAQVPAGAARDAMPPQPGDFIVSELGTEALTPDRVPVGRGPMLAWAMAPDGTVRKTDFMNQLQLFRFEPSELTPEATAMAADGVIGLSVICTHAGCPVSEWLGDVGLLACPCHGSRFNPKENGAVAQGPATRKLPQIALAVTDGKLTVAAPFDSRVGGDEFGVEDR
jgi:Rieske Fe-S protein